MADISLKHIKKVYSHSDQKGKKKKSAPEQKSNLTVSEEGVLTVQDFNLDIKDGEFVVLVGTPQQVFDSPANIFDAGRRRHTRRT